MYKRIFISLLSIALLAGCSSSPAPGTGPSPENEDVKIKNFKTQSTYGAYNGGTALYVYDKTNHQIVTANGNKKFRIQTDDQFEYLNCETTSVPTAEDQALTLNVSAKGIPGFEAVKVYNATVVKLTDNNVWLWAGASSTGFIVPRPL